MFLGAMIAGPLTALLLKLVGNRFRRARRRPPGFKMAGGQLQRRHHRRRKLAVLGHA